jgi:hypothetical protein
MVLDHQVAPLAALFTLNTDLLLNCLQDLFDADASRCLAGGGNNVMFLAHLTDTRHVLVARLGNPLPTPLARYLAEARSIADIHQWPTLEEIRAAWMAEGAHLHDVLDSLNASDLAEPNVQVAFLRRQLGKPAMTYSRGASAGARL